MIIHKSSREACIMPHSLKWHDVMLKEVSPKIRFQAVAVIVVNMHYRNCWFVETVEVIIVENIIRRKMELNIIGAV